MKKVSIILALAVLLTGSALGFTTIPSQAQFLPGAPAGPGDGDGALGGQQYALGLLQRGLVQERHPLLLLRPQAWLGPLLCL